MRYTLKFISLAMLFLFFSSPGSAQDKPQLVVQDGHGEEIVDLTFRAAGAEAVTASEDGTIKIWDLNEGRVLRTLYDKEKYKPHDYKDALKEVVFLSAKDQALVGGNGKFRVFDLNSGDIVSRFEVDNYSGGLASDGQNIFYEGSSELVKASFDGKVLKTYPRPAQFEHFRSLVLGGDNLVAATDKGLYVLDPEALTLKRKIPGSFASRIAISSDGKLLAVNTSETFQILRVADGSVVSSTSRDVLNSQNARTNDFQPYWLGSTPYWGRISNDFDGHVNLLKGSPPAPVKNDDLSYVNALASNQQDDLLISEFNGNFRLIGADGTSREYSYQSAGTTAFKLSLENKMLVTGSRNGAVKIWDLKTGKLSKILKGLEAYVGSLDINPSGTRIVASDYARGQIRVWDSKTGKELSQFKVRSTSFGTGVSKVLFLDNNSYLVLRTSSGRISVVNSETGQEEDYRDLGKDGMTLATVHPNGRRLAVVNRKGIVTELGLDSKRDLLSAEIPGGLGGSGYITYAKDRQSVLVNSRRGDIYRWQYDDPENKPESLTSVWNRRNPIFFSEEADKIVTVGNSGDVTHYYKNGKTEAAPDLAKNYISRPQRVSDDLFIFNSTGNALVLANLSTGEYIGEMVEFDSGKGWAVFTKDGKFDGNDSGLKKLDFELDGSVYRLSQFFNDYYTPGLLTSLLPQTDSSQAPQTKDTRALTAENLKKPPRVDITSPKSGTVLDNADFEVIVAVNERGAGASKVGLYHNGHRLPEQSKTKLDDNTYKFKVKAVKGVNDIRATAFDGSGSVEARRDRLRVTAPNIEARKPRLHLLAVGVDEYKSGLSLKYADDDATSVSTLFDSNIYDSGERVLLTNKEATLDNILGKIDDLAKASEPQDALVIYLAGHGTVLGDTYYFLPHDADVQSDQKLATTALSSELLSKRLSEVPATKQLLVLDSCRSGAAAGVLGKYVAARSGLEEIRSQQLLARSSGTFLIAATQAEDYAYEIPELGHGVLTYSILNSLGKTGESGGKVTTANGLLQSVSYLVPQLTQKYHGTSQQVVQYSSGQDFPLAR